MNDYTLRFVKANPSGNTTVFILDPVSRESYAAIANEVMDLIGAEQVGFYAGGNRIEMMGGEFCGNASRCFAAWLCMGNGDGVLPLAEKEKRVELEISGHSGVLEALVENIGRENGCRVTINMPLPSHIEHGFLKELGTYSLVCFEGITHCVLWQKHPDEKLLEPALALAKGRYNGCLGLMFMGKDRLTPLVYVDDTNSLIWEGSCGSGTVAIACALSDKNKKNTARLELIQPGGSLYADAEYESGRVSAAKLSGDVFFTAVGKVYLSQSSLLEV